MRWEPFGLADKDGNGKWGAGFPLGLSIIGQLVRLLLEFPPLQHEIRCRQVL